MSALQSFTITVNTAWDTLLICDRQARRDYRKVSATAQHVYAILKSEEAVKTYKTIWNATVIMAFVAIALGETARKWADALVECSLEQPTQDWEALDPKGFAAAIAQYQDEDGEMITSDEVEPIAIIEKNAIAPCQKKSAASQKSSSTRRTRAKGLSVVPT